MSLQVDLIGCVTVEGLRNEKMKIFGSFSLS